MLSLYYIEVTGTGLWIHWMSTIQDEREYALDGSAELDQRYSTTVSALVLFILLLRPTPTGSKHIMQHRVNLF